MSQTEPQQGPVADDNTPRTAAFETLVADHRAAFARLARRLARDAEDAEDLLQETLLDAYRGFHGFRPNTHFYSWVARIMTNNHLDRIRRKQHRMVSLDSVELEEGPETLEVPDDSGNPERLLLHDELSGHYQSALEALQPLQRATVMLCDLDGATYEEAAREEACPVGTIRSRLHRAHHALRDFLANLAPPSLTAAVPEGPRLTSRRGFLLMGTAAAAGAALTQISPEEAQAAPPPLRVLVWANGDVPPKPYPHGIRVALADGLRGDRELEVRTASRSDADQGLGDAVLRETDVLVWWARPGGESAGEVREDRVAAVARRVRDGDLGFVALHGACDSAPFRALLGKECGWNGTRNADGSALELQVTAPRHPIARELTAFRIPTTERAEGDLQAPKPDVLVFRGRQEDGATSRQGMVWTVGRGRVFYFQPGDEASPIYFQEEVRQVLRNAVRWCAQR
jgi:RNA polymerase sigma factor (sigma-70 family)